jgi:hypothetical protein
LAAPAGEGPSRETVRATTTLVAAIRNIRSLATSTPASCSASRTARCSFAPATVAACHGECSDPRFGYMQAEDRDHRVGEVPVKGGCKVAR